ncbi:MAG TPA: glycine cleavage T C-terminal barrel domain-containing protein [Thermoanaerobaculia bacterium]|nr:glycine cleavage T C-terminal barrel domain-containing protein [Thermoanaerobaculia bacterium]
MSSAERAAPRSSSLADLHRALGAEQRERWGVRVAVAYTSVPEEAEALHEGSALVDRSWMDVLEISGADRKRFLNALVTCEVRELAEGGGAYGFLTTRKGGVLSDFVLLELGDRFRLELPPGRGPVVADHLGKYVLADRVELSPGTALPLTLIGPGAKGHLRALLEDPWPVPVEARWGHAEITIAGHPLRLAHRPLLGAEAWTLWVEPASSRALAETLLAAPGVLPAGFDALDTVRIEAGVPWWGRDYDESSLPQETGLEEALNFTKGCYLGQEVVARIHYRGAVNRVLRGLQFDGDEPPAEGTGLSLEGRPVGRVGSVAVSPVLEGPIGLALLHKRGAEPGTRLEVEGGGEAEVAALPLVS